MRELGLTGLSEDNRFIVAHDAQTDESFHIPTDRRLTSLLDVRFLGGNPDDEATPSDREAETRESTMETILSPREIQTRIRRGASPEELAAESGMDLEKVQGFAIPVLAEREFMVEQARRTSVRRLHSTGMPGMQLDSLVDSGLVAHGESAESAAWDSWRREDGRWTIVVTPDGDGSPVTFLFDVKGRYVLPADDAAHDLIGDVAAAVLDASPDMSLAHAVAAEPSPAAATAPEVADVEVEADFIEVVEVVETIETVEISVADGVLDDVIEHSAAVWSLKEARDRRTLEQLALNIDAAQEAPREASDVEITERQNVAVPATPQPPSHRAPTDPAKKRHERRRVPSWDEIMFGGGTQVHE